MVPLHFLGISWYPRHRLIWRGYVLRWAEQSAEQPKSTWDSNMFLFCLYEPPFPSLRLFQYETGTLSEHLIGIDESHSAFPTVSRIAGTNGNVQLPPSYTHTKINQSHSSASKLLERVMVQKILPEGVNFVVTSFKLWIHCHAFPYLFVKRSHPGPNNEHIFNNTQHPHQPTRHRLPDKKRQHLILINRKSGRKPKVEQTKKVVVLIFKQQK